MIYARTKKITVVFIFSPEILLILLFLFNFFSTPQNKGDGWQFQLVNIRLDAYAILRLCSFHGVFTHNFFQLVNRCCFFLFVCYSLRLDAFAWSFSHLIIYLQPHRHTKFMLCKWDRMSLLFHCFHMNRFRILFIDKYSSFFFFFFWCFIFFCSFEYAVRETVKNVN